MKPVHFLVGAALIAAPLNAEPQTQYERKNHNDKVNYTSQSRSSKKMNSDGSPIFNGNTDRLTKLRILRAGYVAIPQNKKCYQGTQSSGTIRIVLSDLLKNLNDPDVRTIERRIEYFKPNDIRVNDLNQIGENVESPPQDKINGFRTNIDFYTAVGPNQSTLLVKPGFYVTIRVVLNKLSNQDVIFLQPDVSASDRSEFAIMRSFGTDENIYCNRMQVLDTTAFQSVEFNIQSASSPTAPASPSSGAFGIGLLVRDDATGTVTPIILDPNDHNKG